MNERDRAKRWKSFYDEELKPAMTKLRDNYRSAIDVNSINDTERLKTLLLADKVAQDIEQLFIAISADGELLENQLKHIERLEDLSPRKAKMLRKFGLV